MDIKKLGYTVKKCNIHSPLISTSKVDFLPDKLGSMDHRLAALAWTECCL